MYSVSQRYLNTVASGGKVVTVADLYKNGTLLYGKMAVTGGSVSVDATADIRRSASIDVINPARVQGTVKSGLIEDLFGLGGLKNQSDIFFGSEIVISSGFDYGLGRTELVPLGRFMVWSASLDFGRGDVISLDLFDRAKYLEQTTILKIWDASGKSAQATIQSLVNNSLPFTETVIFEAGLQDLTLAGGSTYDTNHIDAILDIADMMGAEFFFDINGHPQCRKKRSITSSTTSSSAVYSALCNSGGVITSLSRSATRDNVYNGVGVYGTAPDDSTPQPYGEAFDMNSSSPTYWQGSFGKAYSRVDRPELTSAASCMAAAQSILNSSISQVQPAQFEMLPNFALDTGDIILVGYPDDTKEIHVIQTLEQDLDAAGVSVGTQGRLITN